MSGPAAEGGPASPAGAPSSEPAAATAASGNPAPATAAATAQQRRERLAALPPGVLMDGQTPVQPPRPNLGSMLFLTAFFFFMSGGNNMPETRIVVGPDGQIRQRVTELDMARTYVDEYTGWMNGTGNWTEPAAPVILPSSILPPEYQHDPSNSFFTNMTGFYREAKVHVVNLLDPQASDSPFFRQVDLPNLNTSSWNETLAEELRGSWEWAAVDRWDMNIREREVEANTTNWTWIRGSATIYAGEDSSIDYNFYGLHHLANGTYELFAQPDGVKIDIRNIPRLYTAHHNESAQIILAELEKELSIQEGNILLTDAKLDEPTETKCSLLIHLALPPLPAGWASEDIELYESEMRVPTGIRSSLARPPNYWDGVGLGGVVIADECGWAIGLDRGTGVKIDDFWRKSIDYAAFATVCQLAVLVLLVRQMEATRTPSTLAKVSLWTIVLMGISDSWIFSAHVVVGIMSDNRASMAMLVPGFLCLCSAIVFGPRYAVLLHRIQAPERVIPPRPTPSPSPPPPATAPGTLPTPAVQPNPAPPPEPISTRARNLFADHPGVRWLGGLFLIFVVFQVALVPPIVPFFLFTMYSFWIPQIWRNARRGTSHALDHTFVIGTSIGRLGLPLYAFACPENVFFIKTTQWVWGLVAWQWFQIMVMIAQERFGPAFFLPKSFAPEELYNYHPLLPSPDPENPSSPFTGPDRDGLGPGTDEKTCSICMEEVDTRPGPSSEVLLGINPRRSYALAPCHHLFHTKCLQQWLAIKTICPLCKRSLPPL